MSKSDFSSLGDRVVVITGGSGHVGSSLAEAFLAHGSFVMTVDIAKSPDLGEVEGRHQHLTVDLTDLVEVADLPSRVLAAFGRLDVVVCAAAFVGTSATDGWNVPFLKQDESIWSDVLKVNLTSNFTLIKAASEPLAAHGAGSVIFVSSMYALVAPQPLLYEGLPINNPAGYAVSKAGVTQLARWLSTAMAPDVRVNSVTPGGVSRSQDPEFVRRYEERTPMARMATEYDLVGPVLFLASDLACYVNGHDLVVDGGYSIW